MEFNSIIANMEEYPRLLVQTLTRVRASYPVVAILGPRQSGKTTLARMGAPDLPWVHLEDPVEQALIRSDLRGFFERHPKGAIIDEAQRLPELFSALQAVVDKNPIPGRWILTGSQQFNLSRGISQSLAGRVAILTLLPFSYEELVLSARQPQTLAEAVFKGGYAPLYDASKNHDPVEWLSNHVLTLLQHDIADLIGVRNRSLYAQFLGLCASLTGCELNKQTFANTLGIDGKTVEAWLSVLEAAYVIVRLSPHARKFGKRLVSRQKLYFLDTGLACRLMHIRDFNQLRDHHHWGALVETWCVTEILKARYHRGLSPDCWFWRSNDGLEVDLILDQGDRLLPIEIKASATPGPNLTENLEKWRDISKRDETISGLPGLVIYGGAEAISLGEDRFVPWNAIGQQKEIVR